MTSALRPVPAPDFRALVRAERLVLAAAVLLAWFLAWAHPLYPPDEGRYGSVSATMVDTGSCLVPEFRGRAHLTKPPLAYWAQALGIKAFGRSPIAVRLPGLAATSLGLCVLFVFARRGLGTRPAVVATACASVMPMVLMVGRLANTDALLALVWITMLYVGWRVVARDGSRRFLLLIFWSALALGFLIKGPAALGPCLILVAWLGLAGRWRELGRFLPWIGLPLALVPFAAWIALIWMRHPEAGQLWWDETIGRVTGEKELRAEPFWFYLPVFLGGMYPASTILAFPWANVSPRDAWAAFTLGDLRALCLVAVVFPLLGLSVSTGKMPTYLLPLAAPTAMLVTITVERWLRGESDEPVPTYRPPDVPRTLAVVTSIVFAVEMGLAVYAAPNEPELWPLVVPLAVVPLGSIMLWLLSKQGRPARARGLAVAWVAMLVGWTLIFGIETRFTSPWGADRMLASVRSLTGLERPQIATVGFVDPTISFYNGGKPTLEGIELASLRGRTDIEYPLIVAMTPTAVEAAIEHEPEIAVELQRLVEWRRWFARPTGIYLLSAPAVGQPVR